MNYLYKKIIILTVFSSFIFGWNIIFAQDKKTDTLPVPASVQTHCLLTQSWGIEFCPKYRSQIRELNTKLYQERSNLEAQGTIKLVEAIKNKLTNYKSPTALQQQSILEWYPLFIYEYEFYLTALLHHIITSDMPIQKMVAWLFSMTYFDQDQSWLGIKEVKIYKWLPQQYDKSAILQVSIRNYTNNPISNIEDLYCFSTINDQDYIYPMKIKTSFKENSITNLIVELQPEISPLLENSGEKKIACTLVYSQFWQTKYTNRGKLSFIIK